MLAVSAREHGSDQDGTPYRHARVLRKGMLFDLVVISVAILGAFMMLAASSRGLGPSGDADALSSPAPTAHGEHTSTDS